MFKITLREVEIISMENDIALITPISKDLLYVKFAWAAVPLGPRHGRSYEYNEETKSDLQNLLYYPINNRTFFGYVTRG